LELNVKVVKEVVNVVDENLRKKKSNGQTNPAPQENAY